MREKMTASEIRKYSKSFSSLITFTFVSLYSLSAFKLTVWVLTVTYNFKTSVCLLKTQQCRGPSRYLLFTQYFCL